MKVKTFLGHFIISHQKTYPMHSIGKVKSKKEKKNKTVKDEGGEEQEWVSDIWEKRCIAENTENQRFWQHWDMELLELSTPSPFSSSQYWMGFFSNQISKKFELACVISTGYIYSVFGKHEEDTVNFTIKKKKNKKKSIIA